MLILKNSREFNKLIIPVYGLASFYSDLGNKKEAAKYFSELEKLEDSLNVNSRIRYFNLWSKYNSGVITAKQYIETLDNDFNGRLYLPATMKADSKISFYLYIIPQLDSAWRYLNLAKKLGYDISVPLMNYYFAKKNYA